MLHGQYQSRSTPGVRILHHFTQYLQLTRASTLHIEQADQMNEQWTITHIIARNLSYRISKQWIASRMFVFQHCIWGGCVQFSLRARQITNNEKLKNHWNEKTQKTRKYHSIRFRITSKTQNEKTDRKSENILQTKHSIGVSYENATEKTDEKSQRNDNHWKIGKQGWKHDTESMKMI